MINKNNYPISLYNIFANESDKGFSLDIRKGSLNIILGSENSGKSLLSKKIAGFENSVTGQIKYYGKNLDEIKDQNLILYFPSSNIFFENRTVLENLVILGELSNINIKFIAKRIKRISSTYGLEPIKNIKLINLPKSINSILILSLIEIKMPEIVIISTQDFYGDQIREDFFIERLYNLKNLGMTIILSTQRYRNIRNADNIILLSESKALFYGNPRKILNTENPKDIELLLLKKIEESYERIKIN